MRRDPAVLSYEPNNNGHAQAPGRAPSSGVSFTDQTSRRESSRTSHTFQRSKGARSPVKQSKLETTERPGGRVEKQKYMREGRSPPKMPSAAARRLYEDQIPTFMSVFDLDNETMADQDTVTIVDPKMMGMGNSGASKFAAVPPGHLHANALSAESAHRHHDSTSTQTSESADSSPTTTVSCTDSSSLSDPSPSSSPDSPIQLMPLSQLPGPSFGALPSLATLTVTEPHLERPMTSPSPRRPRNMKGLSIQPPFASLSSTQVSEPSSPSFIKPKIPAMKRKPSQLSLKTGSTDLVKGFTLEVPQSPALPPLQPLAPMLQRRALKHSTSSPHILSGLKSATFGPVGGMTIPTVLERNESGLSEFLRPSKLMPPPAPPVMVNSPIPEEESPIRTQMANRSGFDVEPFHEIENNEDQKTPGYPDGPIAIYGDDVYLYLEPSADEASKFDVVINVAREVRDPFAHLKDQSTLKAPQEPVKNDSPIPSTALTEATFATASEFPTHDDMTPTTPKATFSLRQPEYIHLPWDHNTDIGPELMGLCETIDKRVKEGKKVLIHCQQGASRSASLIIAYGLYQNPDLSVNDSYYAAQAKSRWISPNMRLMYCLQDFQKEIAKRRAPPNSGLRPRSGRSPINHRMTLSASDAMEISPKEPLTAPLPAEGMTLGVNEDRSPLRARGNSTPGSRDAVSPGPSSAPSSYSWQEKEDEKDAHKFPRFNIESAAQPTLQLPDSGFGSSSSQEPSFARPPPSPGFGGFNFGFEAPRLGGTGFGSSNGEFLNVGNSVPSNGLSSSFPGLSSTSNGFPGLSSMSKGFPGLSSMSKGFPGLSSMSKGFPGLSSTSNGFPGFSSTSSSSGFFNEKKTSSSPPRPIHISAGFPSDDEALLSPRAETMTNNPLHQPPPAEYPGLRFQEEPPTPTDGLFSPRETMFPRDPFFPFTRPTLVTDPRSPPTKGETPIVRSIDDLI